MRGARLTCSPRPWDRCGGLFVLAFLIHTSHSDTVSAVCTEGSRDSVAQAGRFVLCNGPKAKQGTGSRESCGVCLQHLRRTCASCCKLLSLRGSRLVMPGKHKTANTHSMNIACSCCPGD